MSNEQIGLFEEIRVSTLREYECTSRNRNFIEAHQFEPQFIEKTNGYSTQHNSSLFFPILNLYFGNPILYEYNQFNAEKSTFQILNKLNLILNLIFCFSYYGLIRHIAVVK